MRTLIPAPETISHERNNFDAIRLAMALLVVWSHSFAIHFGSEREEWISRALSGRYNAGNLGVMAFFVISGFLISQSWERSSSARSYFGKRVRRIYPGFLVATSLCAFVIAPLFGGAFPAIPKTLFLNLLLQGSMPAAFPANPWPGIVNGSLWSIPYEFWCYIGVAAGAWLVLKRPLLLIGLTLLLMVGQVALNASHAELGLGPIGQIIGLPLFWTMIGPSFLLGMIAYSYRTSIPRSRILLAGLVIVALATCQTRGLNKFVVAPALAYAVFYTAFSRRLHLHKAAAFGDFSYGTYLYAFPIQQMLQALAGKSLSMFGFVALSLILSLLAGVISWHGIEKHFLTRAAGRPTQSAHPDVRAKLARMFMSARRRLPEFLER